jgi:hypothetical protein
MFSFNRRFENRDDIAGGSSAVLDDRARFMVQQPVVLDVAESSPTKPEAEFEPEGDSRSRSHEESLRLDLFLRCDHVISQQSIEDLCSLLDEEQTCAMQLDRQLRSGNGLGEPVSPFHREVHIIGAPHDEGRRLQLAQLIFNLHSVFVIESCHKPLQIARTLFASNMRSQIDLDVFV